MKRVYVYVPLIFSMVLVAFLVFTPKTNIVKSDFYFLLGDWQLLTPRKGTITTMTWVRDSDCFTAILKSENREYPHLNFDTKYTICKKWGKWYFQDFPNLKRTKAPSLKYKLHQKTIEAYKDWDIYFQGESVVKYKVLGKSYPRKVSISFKDEVLTFSFSKYPNSYRFKKNK